MTPKLTFSIAPKKSKSLVMGTFVLRRENGTTVTWHATSGTIMNQSRSDMWKRGKGIIPPSVDLARNTAVMTEIQHSDNLLAVGEFLFTIWPLNLWSKDGTKKRTSCAVHFDANHETSPGSGGCIVFQNMIFWEQFKQEMQGLSDAGIKECPLEVIYT